MMAHLNFSLNSCMDQSTLAHNNHRHSKLMLAYFLHPSIRLLPCFQPTRPISRNLFTCKTCPMALNFCSNSLLIPLVATWPRLTRFDPSLVIRVIYRLSIEFSTMDLGPLLFFLGIVVIRTSHAIALSKYAFAKEILTCVEMSTCNPYSLPMNTKPKLPVDSKDVANPTLVKS